MFSKINKFILVILFVIVFTLLYFDIFSQITHLIKVSLNAVIFLTMLIVILKFIENTKKRIHLNVKSFLTYFQNINFSSPLKWFAFYYLISIFNILYVVVSIITINYAYLIFLRVFLFVMIIAYIVFLIAMYIIYIICNKIIKFIIKIQRLIKSIKLIYKDEKEESYITFINFQNYYKTFKKFLTFQLSKLNYYKKEYLKTEIKRTELP